MPQIDPRTMHLVQQTILGHDSLDRIPLDHLHSHVRAFLRRCPVCGEQSCEQHLKWTGEELVHAGTEPPESSPPGAPSRLDVKISGGDGGWYIVSDGDEEVQVQGHERAMHVAERWRDEGYEAARDAV